ncbi:Hypothetical protein NCS54_01250800 [Fusarium falciforme]|uniref:Hypothetical protein n=1 Tax=Fusarium falciforme TaxID=195108 RepID=UPI00230043CE|nr:Hypothetical protein NCS54_01250800 [Fusarium falciforme]WAO94905.1 Hypothetical protein NCS54_01250800 [Fusarium falciforme]
MSSANKEYQHFIPQFLLRNYSHHFVCPQAKGPSKKCKKHKHEKGKYPGDPVVNNLCLTSEPYTLEETPVARVFGQLDMYEDMTTSPVKKHRRIEEMLGKTEFDASKIFRRITMAYGKGQPDIWLSRTERNLLRKFLFLLKYRGSGFRRRFYHGDPESYNSNDKELLQDYMEKHGFESPLDVWFHNLETIMTLEMDEEMKWAGEIKKRMFHNDAMWFMAHVQCSYMAICTPANPDEEFILSDNSYNVFEGPSTFIEDEETGERTGSFHAAFHEFAPISPRLMLVLRSHALPVPEEDKIPSVREQRDDMRRQCFDNIYGADVNSMLRDLPVKKATNSYSEIINRVSVLKPGHSPRQSKDDRFCFKFFPIETVHVRKINGIFLDNCYMCSSIAFGSQDAFLKTLDWWLTEPCTTGKIVLGEYEHVHLKYLKNLEAFMKSRGWGKELVYDPQPTPQVRDIESYRLREIEFHRRMERMGQHPELFKGPFQEKMKPYEELGGSWTTLFYDLHQSSLMLKLRIKIDSWSQGVDEAIRRRNRTLLVEEYMNLPCRRFWLYLRQCRLMVLTDGKPGLIEDALNALQGGMEDKLTYLYDSLPSVVVNRYMYEASMMDKVGEASFMRQYLRFLLERGRPE